VNIDIQARRAAQRLADEIADLRELTRDLATTPQLTSSSIDSGSLLVRDDDGSLMGEVGLQHDGTWGATTLNGPEPAAPTPPVLDGGVGVLAVRWDGGLVNQPVLPLDFEAVEVYAATGRDPEITAADRQGVITAQAGGAKVLSLAPGTWRVGLVTRAVSGRRSPLSGLSAGLVEVPADAVAINDALVDAVEGITQAKADAQAAQDWIETTGGELGDRLDAAFIQVGTAQSTADAASTAAGNALSVAEAAVVSANGKNARMGGTTPPSGDGTAVGDTWWQYEDASRAVVLRQWTWDGDEWVQDQYGHEVISSADIGSLTVTGQSTLAAAVIERLYADVVRSRKIGTDMLLVGAGTNLLADPRFTDATLTEARRSRSGATVSSAGLTQTTFMYYGPTSNLIARDSAIQVAEGEVYRIRVPVADITGSAPYIRIERWTAGGSRQLLGAAADTTITDGVAEMVWTVPAGAVCFHPIVYAASGSYTVGPGGSVVQLIDSPLIVDGGVTASKMNVAYTDPETGYGIQIVPEGITLLGPEGNPIVSIRADGSVAIAVLDADGAIVGGIDGDGNVTGRTVSANEGLEYKGTELQELLDALPRGIMAHTRNTSDALVGTSNARLLAVTFRTPKDNRKIRVGFRGHAGTAAPRAYFQLRQAAGDSVGPNNSQQHSWYLPGLGSGHSQSFEFSHTRSVSEWGWPYDATITLGIFVRSLDTGATLNFTSGNNQEMWVEDIGPREDAVAHTPWVPSGGGGTGGGNETQPGKRLYTATFNSTWVQSFAGGPGGSRYAYNPPAQTRGYSGYWSSANGVLSAMWGFDRAAIMAFCSGADMVSARLRLKNDHSGNNGATVIELWNARADSRPNNESGRARIGSPSFSPGQTRWLGVDAAMPELKNGNTSAFRINPPSWRASTADYGYFNGTAVLEITVKK
jgi:hypothetical protein